jgi:L-lactate permease
MNILPILALLPILVVLILLVRFRMAADVAGIIGLAVAVLAAWLYFQTPLSLPARAGLSASWLPFPSP